MSMTYEEGQKIVLEYILDTDEELVTLHARVVIVLGVFEVFLSYYINFL